MQELKNKAKGMVICESAFNGIVNFIANQKCETGGALFGKEDDYIIRKFVPDVDAKTSHSTYEINTDYINSVIKRYWEQEQLSLLGIVHSHPKGFSRLSGPDIAYFRNLLQKSINRKRFFAPIVHTLQDGGFQILPFEIASDGTTISKHHITIVPNNYRAKEDMDSDLEINSELRHAIEKHLESGFKHLESGFNLLKTIKRCL